MTTATADQLLDLLPDLADRHGRVGWPIASIAALVGWSRQKTSRVLDGLVAAGKLAREIGPDCLRLIRSAQSDQAESPNEHIRSDPHLYVDSKNYSPSHSGEGKLVFNKNVSFISLQWRPSQTEIATHVLRLQERDFPEPELYIEFLLHKFLLKNDGKPLRTPHQRLEWWVQNEDLDLAKFMDWKTALLSRGEQEFSQSAGAGPQERPDSADVGDAADTPAATAERRQRRRATVRVDAMTALDRAAARVSEAWKRRQTGPEAEAAEETADEIAGQLPAVVPRQAVVPAPATPGEAREIDEVVRLARDGTATGNWPDSVKRTPPALIEAEIRRHEAAMAPATVAEIRDVLATFVVRTTSPLGDVDALEDAIAATIAGLLKFPRRIFHDAHRRVEDKWRGRNGRLPGIGDFRDAVRTELFEVENYRRLLKQGLSRLTTATTDFSDSERTRRHREAEARRKAEEHEALRRAAEKQNGRTPDEIAARETTLFRPEGKKRPREPL